MDTSQVEQVRSFNRTMTERVGVLNDHFLGRDHPLGEARLLWEIGAEGASVRSLRSRLGLDSGYVSRLLRSLEEQGLIVVGTSEEDGRVRHVQLTEAGKVERAELDHRADAFAHSLLEPLNDSQRAKLATAMAQVERLLIASMVKIAVADPTNQEARWCIEQYFAELGKRFDAGFDPALSTPVQPDELTPPAGLLLLARLREEPIGCGALKFHENGPAEIKRVWVASHARGLGLGRRLLLELEHNAQEAGVTILRLETNRALTEAIQMYRNSGYQEIAAFNNEPYAHHWFEKRL
ncbi:MAG TPA: MarR family winged helix-turn-helix transcriptional regulator [Ktedonobacteraceae bacterium]|nr:MarR family winged helix-turn-helix transcriptional regulator [Ktedonobacteraceae bacterium]